MLLLLLLGLRLESEVWCSHRPASMVKACSTRHDHQVAGPATGSILFSTEPWGLSLAMPISEACRTAAVGVCPLLGGHPYPPSRLRGLSAPGDIGEGGQAQRIPGRQRKGLDRESGEVWVAQAAPSVRMATEPSAQGPEDGHAVLGAWLRRSSPPLMGQEPGGRGSSGHPLGKALNAMHWPSSEDAGWLQRWDHRPWSEG